MVLISLKDYATQKSVSYEAVRKQVRRYQDELEGHIVMDGRQQFLDEAAVKFLDTKRMKHPVVIIQQSKDEEIERLREENNNLLKKIALQGERLEALHTKLEELTEAKYQLEASTEKLRLMEESEAQRKQELDQFKTEAAEADRMAKEALQKAEEAEKEKEAEKSAKEEAETLIKAIREENELLRNRKWHQLLFKPFRKGKIL